MNCNDEDLKAELYSNRAIAYFCLGKDLYISRVKTVLFLLLIQLFRARLSDRKTLHATIPRGIVGGFEFFVLQIGSISAVCRVRSLISFSRTAAGNRAYSSKRFERMAREAMDVCFFSKGKQQKKIQQLPSGTAY